MPADEDLSPAPDDATQDKDLRDDAEEAREEFDSELTHLLDTTTQAVSQDLTRVEAVTFESQSLRNRAVTRSPLEAARNSKPSARLQEVELAVRNVTSRNGSDSGGGTGGDSVNRDARYSAARWMAFMGIVVLAGVGVLFEELYRARNNKDDSDIPLSDATKQQIKDLVNAWAKQDDTTFWGSLSTYVTKNAFTLADLVYFMQYTQQLFPLTTPFMWDTFDDKAKLVDMLVDLYKGSGSDVSDVLGYLSGLTYKDVVVPRNIQANVAELAFAAVIT